MGTAARLSRQQSENHTAYWREPQGGDLTYVALGDSAGVGVGAANPADGYVGLVAMRLEASTGRSARIVNLSVSGARARDVLEQQMPILATLPAPDVVTCIVGGNDVAWSTLFRARRFAHTMAAIADGLPPGSVLGLLPHFVHWPYDARACRANATIRAIAADRGLPVADIHSPTRALGLRDYLATFAADRFHPNERGHRLWADAITRAV